MPFIRVHQALEFFDNMFNRQNVFDKRLQSIENKLDKLTLGVVGPQDDDDDEEMSCHGTAGTAPAGTVPAQPSVRPETLTAGGISSAVASVIAEEKDKDKRKLNIILHNVLNLQQRMGNRERRKILILFLIFFRKV